MTLLVLTRTRMNRALVHGTQLSPDGHHGAPCSPCLRVFSCASSFSRFSKFFGAFGKHRCASVVDLGSQVSRHLISAARGRTTEIFSVLSYYVAKPLLREKA